VSHDCLVVSRRRASVARTSFVDSTAQTTKRSDFDDGGAIAPVLSAFQENSGAKGCGELPRGVFRRVAGQAKVRVAWESGWRWPGRTQPAAAEETI
jgi:hypothetical protein